MTNAQKLAKNYLDRVAKEYPDIKLTEDWELGCFHRWVAEEAKDALSRISGCRKLVAYVVENVGAFNGCCHAEWMWDTRDREGDVRYAVFHEIMEAIQGYESYGHRLPGAARKFVDDVSTMGI